MMKNKYQIFAFIYFIAQITQATSVSIPTHDFPINAITADFNQDGFDDIAVINIGCGLGCELTIYLNDGCGNFKKNEVYTLCYSGNFLSKAICGFFNKTQHIDIAVSYPSNNSFQIFLNKGNGSFTPTLPIKTRNKPTGIISGNFRGLGKEDIAVINAANSHIAFYFMDNDKRFNLAYEMTLPDIPGFIAAGDLNNNGYDDLVIIYPYAGQLQVFTNDKTGHFTQGNRYTLGMFPATLILGDFNNNGLLDIAATNIADNTVSVLLNQTSGDIISFSSPMHYKVGDAPVSLAFCDSHNDGILDILVANEASSSVTLLKNDKKGGFSQAFEKKTQCAPLCILNGKFFTPFPNYMTVNLGNNSLEIEPIFHKREN